MVHKHYVDRLVMEQRSRDTSFTDRGLLGFEPKYPQHEVREVWFRGIAYGIEIGLHKASLEGQRVELHSNSKTEKQREFLDRFYELCNQYGCAIQYHPEVGMVVIDRYYHGQATSNKNERQGERK